MRGIVTTVGRTVPMVDYPEDPGPEQYEPDPHYADWSDEDVAAEHEKVAAEHRRRQAMADAAESSQRATVAYQAAAGVRDGDPWVRPVAVGYPKDACATHDGHMWVNRVPNNFHEPGVSGWRIEAIEGEPPPPFVKPTSPFDAYEYGVKVTHGSDVYRSIFELGDGLNYWSPSEMPEYWELVNAPDPAPDPDPEPDDVPVWVRPTWGGDEGGAYKLGDLVRYPDEASPIYESVHDGWNTWPPDEYGWQVVES